MQPTLRTFTNFASVVLLGLLLPIAVAHGHGDDMSMDMEVSPPRPTIVASAHATVDAPESYFQHGSSGLMVAHIALMTLGWVFVLPIAVMFSIARSRFSLVAQFTFLLFNGFGVLCSTIYNANAPDLYPNNAHHKLGWLLTWVMSAQAVIGLLSAYTGRKELGNDELGAFIPVSTEAMVEHQRMHETRALGEYRFSNDSGQGTERNTESLRSQSISSAGGEQEQTPKFQTSDAEDEMEEKHGLLQSSKVDQFLSKRIPGMISSRVLRVLQFAYDVVNRLILILGFIALMTGIVTYGGIFRGSEVFSGLAHFIKGGVFFWYGILTLGRWAGCFADIGWSWNINPAIALGGRKKWQPSAEFVESFLIFFYGSTNVFLEHLTAWGSEWSAQDLEHISITIMFFGGGLCGMLIESSRVRNLLNATVNAHPTSSSHPSDLSSSTEIQELLKQPKSYSISMNPIPALVVLLLGLMMSSHHQHSMISTMVHKQWGTLLAGCAFARAATYVVFYVRPPTSMLPGRPPTELVTAFCLMAGGLIFMASSKDTIKAMETYDLDAMFVFTVSMGIITFLMAWIILVIALKGWAGRKERRSKY